MNGRITLQSGGTSRSYILRAPDNYDNKHPYPFVLAYHESGADAMAVASGTNAAGSPYYGLWNLANNSAMFVAPEGLNGGWANTGGEDVTFTDAILQQVEGNLCVDTNHVFATGFSYGGAMAYALACARANVFRAVAVSSAALLSGCAGGTMPVPYFATRGVQEPVTRPHHDRRRAARPHRHGQWLQTDDAAGAGGRQRHAHLHVVRRLQARVPGRVVCLRRRSHARTDRQRAKRRPGSRKKRGNF